MTIHLFIFFPFSQWAVWMDKYFLLRLRLNLIEWSGCLFNNCLSTFFDISVQGKLAGNWMAGWFCTIQSSTVGWFPENGICLNSLSPEKDFYALMAHSPHGYLIEKKSWYLFDDRIGNLINCYLFCRNRPSRQRTYIFFNKMWSVITSYNMQKNMIWGYQDQW